MIAFLNFNFSFFILFFPYFFTFFSSIFPSFFSFFFPSFFLLHTRNPSNYFFSFSFFLFSFFPFFPYHFFLQNIPLSFFSFFPLFPYHLQNVPNFPFLFIFPYLPFFPTTSSRKFQLPQSSLFSFFFDNSKATRKTEDPLSLCYHWVCILF